MKIEKVNENQIRCTLTREDLASRELKISELAYGTEKAKTLFRDMMRQANFEFGFEAEDIPLMIEAIPLNAECIVLIITKVEDPEELDTRFSRFAPSVTEEGWDEDEDGTDAADEMFDLLRRMQAQQGEEAAPSPEQERTRVFLMGSLSQVMEVSALLAGSFQGLSSLYKAGTAPRTGTAGYLLLIAQGSDTAESFDRACNLVSEYGIMQRSSFGSGSYLSGHCESLIRGNAVQVLGRS